MQKKLIALAVAGLVAAPAFAQSNVTIYGVADAYFGFVNGKTAGDGDTKAVVGSGLLSAAVWASRVRKTWATASRPSSCSSRVSTSTTVRAPAAAPSIARPTLPEQQHG